MTHRQSSQRQRISSVHRPPFGDVFVLVAYDIGHVIRRHFQKFSIGSFNYLRRF
jgi:hypothetical protein